MTKRWSTGWSKPPSAMAAVLLLMGCVWTGVSFSHRNRFAGRTLRIGFDQAPPYSMIGPDGGPRGLAVALIQEAARRQQIGLQWIKVDRPDFTGFDVDKMIVENAVDLWPLVGITPERLKRIHVAQPWIENNFFLISRLADPVETPVEARGKRIVHNSGPLSLMMSRRFFSKSELVSVGSFSKILGPVCRGTAAAAFAEARTLEGLLLNRTTECNGVALKVTSVRNAVSRAGIGSRREVAAEAEAITGEIVSMVSDGTFAREAEKWSSFSATETRSLLALARAEQRERLVRTGLWTLFVTCLALACIAWLTYRARRIAEVSRERESGRA